MQMKVATKMKKILLIIIPLFLFSCAQDSQEKYDLKSPCVSAEIIDNDNFDTPCVRRSVNRSVI